MLLSPHVRDVHMSPKPLSCMHAWARKTPLYGPFACGGAMKLQGCGEAARVQHLQLWTGCITLNTVTAILVQQHLYPCRCPCSMYHAMQAVRASAIVTAFCSAAIAAVIACATCQGAAVCQLSSASTNRLPILPMLVGSSFCVGTCL